MAYFQFEGRAVCYRLLGSSDNPLMVLAHPLGGTQSIWDHMLTDLLRDYRVLTWDLPGHGGSQAWPSTADAPLPTDLAAEALALCRLAGAERFHFVGTSIGGVIGQQLLIDHPDRLLSLTLTNTGAVIGTMEAWQDRALRVRAEGLHAAAPDIIARWFSAASVAGNPALVEGWKIQLSRGDDFSYALFSEMVGRVDFRGQLPRLPDNVRLVGGIEDPATPPSTLEALAQELGGLPVTILEGASHVPSVDQPEALLKVIREG